MAGSRAVSDREPGQVRKEAALSEAVHAPRTSLAGAEERRARPGTFHGDGCTVHIFRRMAAPERPSSSFAAGAQVLLAIVAVMWGLEIVDVALDHRLDNYGIEPRDVDALPGIVSSPFLHAGFPHLIGNTIPLVVMGLAIALAGAMRLISVTVIVGLIAGFGTWLTASANTETIGASGLVFGYATYLMTRFFFSRRLLDLALGIGVLVVWGASLLASLAPTPGVSWQAHLFGAIGGVVAARVVDQRPD